MYVTVQRGLQPSSGSICVAFWARIHYFNCSIYGAEKESLYFSPVLNEPVVADCYMLCNIALQRRKPATEKRRHDGGRGRRWKERYALGKGAEQRMWPLFLMTLLFVGKKTEEYLSFLGLWKLLLQFKSL